VILNIHQSKIYESMLENGRTEEHITHNIWDVESLAYICINSQSRESSSLQSAKSNPLILSQNVYLYKILRVSNSIIPKVLVTI